MIKKRCKRCAVPLAYGRHINWTTGGTIAVERAPELRLFFIEIDELLNLLSHLNELMTVPIDKILIDSEQPIGRGLVESIFPASLLKLTRSVPSSVHPRPLVKKIFTRIADYARCMGFGSTTLIDYGGGRKILIRVRNAHSLPMVIGDIVGILYVLLGVDMTVAWKKENGTTLIEFQQTDEKPREIALASSAFVAGQVDLPTCPTCGAPLAVSELFEFDMLNGIITNRRTAYREAFLSVQGINVIFSELKKELGEDVSLMMALHQAELMRERMSMRNLAEEGGITAFFEELRVRGMGNPVAMEEEGQRLQVKVENPFNDALMAGRIAGYYEAAENVRSKITWVSSDEGHMVLTLEPGT